MERTKRLQEETNKVILPFVADPVQDLANERKKTPFDTKRLTAFLFGSLENAQRKNELVELLANDPNFSKAERYFKNQPELYEYIQKVNFHLRELITEKGITSQEEIQILQRAVGFPSGLDLHFGMFLPTILGQGTPEHHEEYLQKAISLNIFGTYAQTELGHGTFLRGLETTATFDKETQEFILHSPTLTSLKWWPGGLAKTANHVVLMARLFIEGKDHGPQPFIVQIREMNDHYPLPGIEVGDIGPKLGFNTVDNGYLKFDHVRIPKSAHLSKNGEVTPEGKFVSKSSPKAAYGTMIMIRSILVFSAGTALTKAVTIATRYSAVRRQTSESPKQMEKQVLDYQNQQNQIFPLIATTFALHFTGNYMKALFQSYSKGSKSGDVDSLPEVHATSSGLKALVTSLTAAGIEACRLACGGHGFSHFSGLPLLYEDYVGACTYEGENNVMHLQTARYLMKIASQALKGDKLSENCRYLLNFKPEQKCAAKSADDFLDPKMQLFAFQHMSASVIFETFHLLETKRKTLPEGEAWNSCICDLIRCSVAHCTLMLVSKFIAGVEAITDNVVRSLMKQQCDLFVLSTMEKNLGEFSSSSFFTSTQVRNLREQVRKQLEETRDKAVGLVDSWMIHDYEMNSALGRHDGDVYRALYQSAKLAPLNRSHVAPGYHQYLQPRFRANL